MFYHAVGGCRLGAPVQSPAKRHKRQTRHWWTHAAPVPPEAVKTSRRDGACRKAVRGGLTGVRVDRRLPLGACGRRGSYVSRAVRRAKTRLRD